jgi:hypothetical protein
VGRVRAKGEEAAGEVEGAAKEAGNKLKNP